MIYSNSYRLVLEIEIGYIMYRCCFFKIGYIIVILVEFYYSICICYFIFVFKGVKKYIVYDREKKDGCGDIGFVYIVGLILVIVKLISLTSDWII